jgi:tetratricopeptide (TPR) repeat protein
MRRGLILIAGLLLVLLAWWQTALLVTGASRNRVPAAAQALPLLRVGNADPATLLPEILNSGEVDERALAAIERRGDPSVSAAAYFVAARYEHEHKRREPALRFLQRALEFAPDHAGLLAWHAALLRETGQYSEAIDQAERAAQLDPNLADAQRILGFAYYDAGRTQDAVDAWERSLRLAPSAEVKSYLDKARRETKVEENFAQTARGHFVLRYEGAQPRPALIEDLLSALERQFEDLTRDLGSSPSAAIVVTLYRGEQFSEVTRAPSWAGAVNDGKLRVPFGDVPALTPQIEAVLRHELTHSFVRAAAPNCPTWLNEGLAQYEEPRSSAAFAARLAEQLQSGQATPLRELEGSFLGLSSEQAQTAYAESLAAVEYLRSAYGLTGLQHILGALANGEDADEALRQTTRGGYADLQRELAIYLASRS